MRRTATAALGAVLAACAAQGTWAAVRDGAKTGRFDHEHAFSPEEERAARLFPEAFDGVTVSIERLGPSYRVRELPPISPEPPVPDELVMIDRIINIGKKIWQIIKDNEPVVNVTKDYATATPEGIKRWDSLVGWRSPEGTIYGFKAVNKFGAQAIYCKYQVVRTFGGSYRDKSGARKGRYLTGVTVEPLLVEVAWGYRFDMEAKVPTVVNAGETSEDPLAAMIVNLEWKISTVMKKAQGTAVYYVRGDGLFREVGGPFRQDFQEKAPAVLRRLPAAPFIEGGRR